MTCIILFVGMCLFIASFEVVEPTYMAISRNKISSVIDDTEVYFPGRHFIGVGNEFIFFPMAWQLIEFTDDISVGTADYICKVDTPLESITSNNAEMMIELSLYFRIPPQQLINFYRDYGVNYQDFIAGECKTLLKETISKFRYEEVFTGRLMISEAMTNALRRRLASRRCVLEKVLLRGISFTDALEATIESSVMADQRKTANEYVNQINIIHAEIEGLKKDNAYKMNIVLAEAQKNATIYIEEAKAYATSVYASSTATAWKAYQELTELDTESLLRVQWARTLGATTEKDTIALGYDTVGTKFVQKVSNA